MVKEDVLAYLGNIKKANISTCTNYGTFAHIFRPVWIDQDSQ